MLTGGGQDQDEGIARLSSPRHSFRPQTQITLNFVSRLSLSLFSLVLKFFLSPWCTRSVFDVCGRFCRSCAYHRRGFTLSHHLYSFAATTLYCTKYPIIFLVVNGLQISPWVNCGIICRRITPECSRRSAWLAVLKILMCQSRSTVVRQSTHIPHPLNFR